MQAFRHASPIFLPYSVNSRGNERHWSQTLARRSARFDQEAVKGRFPASAPAAGAGQKLVTRDGAAIYHYKLVQMFAETTKCAGREALCRSTILELKSHSTT